MKDRCYECDCGQEITALDLFKGSIEIPSKKGSNYHIYMYYNCMECGDIQMKESPSELWYIVKTCKDL